MASWRSTTARPERTSGICPLDGTVGVGRSPARLYMSTRVVSVRVPSDLKRRLDALSSETGRPVTFHVREALEQHVCEHEDVHQLRVEVGSHETLRTGHDRQRRAQG